MFVAADFRETTLSGTKFAGADLSKADLSGVDLIEVNLSWSDLNRADLSKANLTGANLSQANLRGTILFAATLSNSWLSEARIDRSTSLRNLRFAKDHDEMNDGADTVGLGRFDRIVNWEKLRFLSEVPLFGVSYVGLGLLFASVHGVDITNRFGLQTVRSALDEFSNWLAAIPPKLDDIRADHPTADKYLAETRIGSWQCPSHFGSARAKARLFFVRTTAASGSLKAPISVAGRSFYGEDPG